jgi:hypothetical protein
MKLFKSLEDYANYCQEEKLKEVLKSPEIAAIKKENIPIDEKIAKLDKAVEEKMR